MYRLTIPARTSLFTAAGLTLFAAVLLVTLPGRAGHTDSPATSAGG